MILLLEACHNVRFELERAMKLHGFNGYEELPPGNGYRRFWLLKFN